MPTHAEVSADSPEISAAAKWWADQLRTKPKHDNGDATHALLYSLVSAVTKLNPPEVADRFEVILRGKLAAQINDGKSWYPEEPNRASYNRGVYVDYHAPPVLMDSLAEAGGEGGDMMTFPCKTSMWINPGKVIVKNGYGADEQTIYSGNSSR